MYFYSTPFFKLVVPTVDTVRYQFLVSTLVKSFNPVMMVGPVGTGKTSVIESAVNKLDSKSYSVLTVNMSAQVNISVFCLSRVSLIMFPPYNFVQEVKNHKFSLY